MLNLLGREVLCHSDFGCTVCEGNLRSNTRSCSDWHWWPGGRLELEGKSSVAVTACCEYRLLGLSQGRLNE